MKLKNIFIFGISLFLCVLITACADEKKPSDNKTNTDDKTDTEIQDTLSVEEVKALSDNAISLMSGVPEYPEGYPTLQDAAALYKKANMAIGWIISTEPVAVYEDDSIIVDGLTYKKVRPDCFYGKHNLEHHKDELGETQKLIYDLKSLESYIGTIINPSEVKEYMTDAKELKKFTQDENGSLYVLPFSYEPTGYGEEKYTLNKNDDNSYTFTVNYTLTDENGEVYKERSEDFEIVNIDGRWVFDDFRVIRQN